MDAARRAMCRDDLWNPLTSTFIQSRSMLLMSHLFHVVLKPLEQPGPIAQILAGLALGPSFLGRIKQVSNLFNQPDLTDYNIVISFIFRIAFMFMIGLETDIPYMRLNIRQASIIAYGGIVACAIFGVSISVFVIPMLNINDHKFMFANFIMVILASCALPTVIRLVAELKFETSDIGRLAVSSSLINEMTCLLWYNVIIAFTSGKMFDRGILCLVFTAVVTLLNKFLALWYNRRRQNQRSLRSTDMLTILVLVILFSFLIEKFEFSSTLFCFIIGLMFPREGKIARTLLRRLAYAVNNFILPIYFGYIGFRFNVTYLYDYRNVTVVFLVILISTGGKIIGTLAASYHLKTSRNEGVILAFVLNLKGHGKLLLMEMISESLYVGFLNHNSAFLWLNYQAISFSYMYVTLRQCWWDENFYNLVVIVVVLNTLLAGSIVSSIISREEKFFSKPHNLLEFDDPDEELKMLLCVYSSRGISGKIGLISILRGSIIAPIKPYLMHLVELPKKRSRTNMMYHELEDRDQFSDEEEYGGNDVIEIGEAVDVLSIDSKVPIHLSKIVLFFATMYEDVCASTEDLHASIMIPHWLTA